MARIALLFVVFVDILGQGLLLPILSSLLLDPSQNFLPQNISQDEREFRYGLVLGLFFLAWFFGAAFISKLSDYVGRKISILICLIGAVAGYGLTFAAIENSNFTLLVAGRLIGGFTAGNQPIAQAALIDQADNEKQKAKFLGQMVAAVSLGLVTGPLLTATLSSEFVLGSHASVGAPVLAALALVVTNIFLVVFFFRETLAQRRKIDFGVSEVFLTLLRLRHHKTTLWLAPVFFFAVMGFNSFFVFLGDFLIARFGFNTVEISSVMVVLGVTMGTISLCLVGPILTRYSLMKTVLSTIVITMVFIGVYVANPFAVLTYFLVIPIIAAFGITYPALLSMFSASVDDKSQGWVMGVCVALFTLGSGLTSVIGGFLMQINPNLPLIFGLMSSFIAVILILVSWRDKPEIVGMGLQRN